MSAVVVDSSAFVDTIADPLGYGIRVLGTLAYFNDWWAPEILDAEVAHGLRNQVMRGLILLLARATGPRCEFLLVEPN